MENTEKRGPGIKNGEKWLMKQSISIRPVQPRKTSASKGEPIFSKYFRLDRNLQKLWLNGSSLSQRQFSLWQYQVKQKPFLDA